MMKILSLVALLGLSLLMSGCGTTLPRAYDLGSSSSPARIAPGQENGLPLVVIRFPARVAARAVEQYNTLYDDRGFFNIFYNPDPAEVIVPWAGLNTDKRPRDMQGASTEAISKSTYLAVALYSYLSDRMPPGAVKLMPTEIDLKDGPARKDGAAKPHDGWPKPLVERTTYDYPPAVIYVDVFAYVNPFHRTEGTTFGASMMPLFSAHTAQAVAPKTGGALVLPDAFLPYVRRAQAYETNLNGIGGPFVEYLNGAHGVPADHFDIASDARTVRLPTDPGKVLVLPVAEFGMDAANVSKQDGSFERPLFDAYYAILASAENSIDRSVATRLDETRYIALFDPSLSGKFAARTTLSRQEGAALGLIHQFALAEWKLIGLQDEDFSKQLLQGEWGTSYRKTRDAEQKFRVTLDKAYESHQNAMMMQVFSQGMPSLMSGRQTPQAMLQNSVNRLQLSLDLNEKDKAAKRELAADTQQFQSRLSGVSNESVRFVFDLTGQSTTVEARSVAELRAKMRVIYMRAGARP